MAGLADGSTGLMLGHGLQFQTAIGGAGFAGSVTPAPPGGASLDFSHASNSMYVPLLRFSIVGLIGAAMAWGMGMAIAGNYIV